MTEGTAIPRGFHAAAKIERHTPYSFDYRGQMTGAVQSGGGRAEYRIDAFGNRIGRDEYDASDTLISVEEYALDGWNPAKPVAVGTENFDAYADLDAFGTVTSRRLFGDGFDEVTAKLDSSASW